MNKTHTVKHLRRPGYENNTLRSLNTNRSVDDSIPKITGFKDNMNYQLWINDINFDTSPPTPGPNAAFQFSFNVFNSLRTDFPDYNNGDPVDPCYQGNGHTSYLLLDLFVGDTHQNAAKIIIQGDKITNPNAAPYVFNFLSTKNSLLHIMEGLQLGEKMVNISIVITPYDDQDWAGFPITIMFDKFGKSFVFNQDDIDHFHVTNVQESVNIFNFELGSYNTDFFIVPDYQFNSSGNIDISGFCNNNDYGVNIIFKTTNTDNNNGESAFLFNLFPFSNVAGLNSDFPISFRDQDHKNFGTLYATDPSIRLITEVSKSKTPVSAKQNYFKLINIPKALIMKKNNMGIDSLMQLNKRFMQNVVVVPKTVLPSSTIKFLIKNNERIKPRKLLGNLKK